MAFSFVFLLNSCVCKKVSLYVFLMLFLGLFFLWLLICPILICLFLFYFIYFNTILYMPDCFPMRDRKGLSADGRGSGADLRRVWGGVTIIRIYCWKNKTFSLTNKKRVCPLIGWPCSSEWQHVWVHRQCKLDFVGYWKKNRQELRGVKMGGFRRRGVVWIWPKYTICHSQKLIQIHLKLCIGSPQEITS